MVAQEAAIEALPGASVSQAEDAITSSLQARYAFINHAELPVVAACATSSNLLLVADGRDLRLYDGTQELQKRALPSTSHGSQVKAIHYNATGDHFILVYASKEARICDVKDLAMHDGGVLTTGQSSILASAWMRGRQELVTSGNDGSLRFYTVTRHFTVVTTGRKLLSTMRARMAIHSECRWMLQLAIDEAEQRVICASERDVLVWSAPTGEILHRFPALHDADIRCVAYCTAAQRLLTTSYSGIVKKWALGPSGAILMDEFIGHSKGVTAIQTVADGRLMLTSSEDGSLRVWNTESARELHCFVPATAPAHSQAVENYSIPHPSALLVTERLAAGGHSSMPQALVHVVCGAMVSCLEVLPPAYHYARATDAISRILLVDSHRGVALDPQQRMLLLTAQNNTLQASSRAGACVHAALAILCSQ